MSWNEGENRFSRIIRALIDGNVALNPGLLRCGKANPIDA